MQGDRQQAGRLARCVLSLSSWSLVGGPSCRSGLSLTVVVTATALLQRIGEVQGEANKLKSENETLQTCSSS